MCAYRKVRRTNSSQRRPVRRQSDSYDDESEYPEHPQQRRRPAHSRGNARNYKMQTKSNNTTIIVISIVVVAVLLIGAIFLLNSKETDENNSTTKTANNETNSNEEKFESQGSIVNKPTEENEKPDEIENQENNQPANTKIKKIGKTNNDAKLEKILVGNWTSASGLDLEMNIQYNRDKSFIAKVYNEDGLKISTFLGNWKIKNGYLFRNQHTVIIGNKKREEITYQEHKIITLTEDSLIIADNTGIQAKYFKIRVNKEPENNNKVELTEDEKRFQDEELAKQIAKKQLSDYLARFARYGDRISDNEAKKLYENFLSKAKMQVSARRKVIDYFENKSQFANAKQLIAHKYARDMTIEYVMKMARLGYVNEAYEEMYETCYKKGIDEIDARERANKIGE